MNTKRRAERAAVNGRVWRLTPVELGALLLLLNAGLWGAAAVNIATPGSKARSGLIKGADFVHFYTLGSIAAERRGDLLYDAAAQHVEQVRLVPTSEDDWHVPANGPQMALLFAPLARLSYLWAAAVWALVTALVYAFCVWVVWRRCVSLHQHRLLAALGASAFPPFWYLVLYGQTSALPLLCLTCGWLALRANRKWWAGVALGSLIIKPQLGLAVAAVMLGRREWRIVGGAMAAIAFQWGIAVAAVGTGPLRDHIRLLLEGPRLAGQVEPVLHLFKAHSLRSFWALLCPGSSVALALYLLTGAAVLVITVLLWRESVPLDIRYSALLLATVLVAPHMLVYELVQLAPAFLLAAERLQQTRPKPQRAFVGLLCLAYIFPLAGGVTRATHIQFSVPVFLGWLIVLYAVRVSPDLRVRPIEGALRQSGVSQ